MSLSSPSPVYFINMRILVTCKYYIYNYLLLCKSMPMLVKCTKCKDVDFNKLDNLYAYITGAVANKSPFWSKVLS